MTRTRRQTIYDYVERASAVLDQVDYYRLLNISSAASTDDIRNAYYKLAASLHPDIHGVDVDDVYRGKLTAVFSRVAEAYKILSKPEMRRRYDRELARGNLRISMGADVAPSGPQVVDANALRFFRLGEEAMASGQFKSAIMNLQFALQREPENEVIQEALRKAQDGKNERG